MPARSVMNSASVLSGVLFGGIGAAALLYGHRQARWKPMVIGALLVAVSYLVKNTALIWLAGSALTGSLWWFRD